MTPLTIYRAANPAVTEYLELRELVAWGAMPAAVVERSFAARPTDTLGAGMTMFWGARR